MDQDLPIIGGEEEGRGSMGEELEVSITMVEVKAEGWGIELTHTFFHAFGGEFSFDC